MKSESLEKTLMFGKFEGLEEKEMTEDEMVNCIDSMDMSLNKL